MKDSYRVQVDSLVEAGVDILLPETVIDTLNLKACLFAIQEVLRPGGRRVPVMVSGPSTKAAAPLSVGKVSKRSWTSLSHFPLLSIGMNCARARRDAAAPGGTADLPTSSDQLSPQRRPAQ